VSGTPDPKDAPFATVVVCTHNRADVLGDALRSLVEDGSETPREVVVVDNASTDGTPEVCEKIQSASSVPFRYVVESRLGLANARNTGVAAAAGEVILFTDDDVIVEKGWVDALCRPFSETDVGAVGGRVLPLWPAPPPPWMLGPPADAAALPDFGTEPHDMPNDPSRLPVGANMAVRGDLLRRMDPPFDSGLGVVGGLRIDGEEILLMQQIRSQHRVVYVPDAVIHHRVDPRRIDMDWLRGCFFQKGFGTARVERMVKRDDVGSRRERVKSVLRAYRETVRARPPGRDPESREAGSVAHELWCYYRFGREIDQLLYKRPAVANWMAAHAATTPLKIPDWARRRAKCTGNSAD
jgi:glycosyltransferase involved in cell wall biosynthesis